ncbi:tetratricopeptide repeat protein [bacterium]|nr:tetratricopeptide repeat protein [bacterium]
MNKNLSTNLAPLLATFALAATIIVAYSHTLSYPFIFDDVPSIESNQHIRMKSLSWQAMEEAMTDAPVAGRPISYLTFALNYWIGGLDVRGFHIVNIAIHFLASLLVYFVSDVTLQLYRATEGIRVGWLNESRRTYIAILAALLFALHPIQIQSVTYLVQRMNSLASMLFLLALWLYILGRLRPMGSARILFWLAAGVAWGLALGSKQIAIVWPVTVLLYEWFFFQNLSAKWLRRGLALFSIVGVILLGIAIVEFRVIGSVFNKYSVREFTLEERLLTQPRVLATYARLFVLPIPSQYNLLHDVRPSRSVFDPPTTFLAIVALIGYTGIAFAMSVRNRLLAFCMLWPLVTLVVESSILPLELIYEHRMYLPMFGLTLATAYVTGRLLLRQPLASWAIVLATVVLVLTSSTVIRNTVWKDHFTLWSDVIKKSPDLARPLVNRAGAHASRSDWLLAMNDYDKAIQISPMFDLAWVGRGLARLNTGNVELSIDDFTQGGQRALSSDILTACYRNRAQAWSVSGNPARAIADYRRAIAYEPDDAVSRFNLANAYRLQKNFEDALAQYEECIKRRPDLPSPFNNLAALLTTCADQRLRDYKRAVELATEACVLTQWKDWNSLDTLAEAYAAQGRYAEAAKFQGQAATVAPPTETLRLRRRQETYTAKSKQQGKPSP